MGNSSLLNIEGGTISGNHVNGSGAGIFAICSRGNKHNMDVNISGGTITNITAEQERMKKKMRSS